MTKITLRKLLAGLLPMLVAAPLSAQTDTLFVHMKSGAMYAFPTSLILNQEQTDHYLSLDLVGDTTCAFALDDIKQLYNSQPYALPSFTSFKFNNKYNNEIYQDVDAVIGEDSVTASVAAIGKTLVPSFRISDDAAYAYVGNTWQRSKVSRQDFTNDVTYVVGYPEHYVYGIDTLSITNDTTSRILMTPVALTTDMMSSNLPGDEGESFEQMLDGNPSTIFHSTWSVPDEEKEKVYHTSPYIDFAIGDTLRNIQFSYTTRNRGTYWPITLVLLASHDGETWEEKRVFTADDDGLPMQAATSYTSPGIDLGDEYEYLRLRLDSAGHRRYLVLAEFALYKITPNPDYNPNPVIEVVKGMRHYGHRYTAHIDWLTDRIAQVPRIDINIEGGKIVTSKTEYLNAEIIIDGRGIFPSMTDSVKIKGRGNTSWSNPWVDESYGQYNVWYNPKNPYRLKFSEKKKPFGLKNGKNWVLLANSQKNSMMSNAVGMKLANIVGTAAANHIVPVELYINGDYRGCYNFTEKVGMSNNSIDIKNEIEAALLELDTYYDEVNKFRDSNYRLPVNVKFPEFGADESHLSMTTLKEAFNRMTSTIKNGGEVSTVVDVNMLARYLMVNELICNFEIMHPKSTYLYCTDVLSDTAKWVLGPVWDLDYAYGYEHSNQYATTDMKTDFYTGVSFSGDNGRGINFFHDLRYTCESVDKAYYKVWHDFMENGGLEELLSYCNSYYHFANSAMVNDYDKWQSGDRDYSAVAARMASWLSGRAQHIYANLTPYELDDNEPDEPVADGIENVGHSSEDRSQLVDVYTVDGIRVKSRVAAGDIRTGLKPGIYIVGGKKLLIK